MLVGAAGLLMAWQGIAVGTIAIPLMLLALFAMGVHSTFFGPIKYAILPQHLRPDEVLGGTGLVEAGTYIAILGGTLLAGIISVAGGRGRASSSSLWSAIFPGGRCRRRRRSRKASGIDFNIIRSSIRLVRATLHIRRLFLAIVAISFFWTIGAVLFIQFPPLVKNVLTADRAVASLFLAIFSVGVAIGSVAINRLLKGQVSARFAARLGASSWACSSSPSTSPRCAGTACPATRSTTSAPS